MSRKYNSNLVTCQMLGVHTGCVQKMLSVQAVCNKGVRVWRCLLEFNLTINIEQTICYKIESHY